MSQLKVPEWVQNNDSDKPTVYSGDLGGGYTQVADSAARADIPADKRAVGMIVSYDSSGVWITERYEGADATDPNWVDEGNWVRMLDVNSDITANFADTSNFAHDVDTAKNDFVVLGETNMYDTVKINSTTSNSTLLLRGSSFPLSYMGIYNVAGDMYFKNTAGNPFMICENFGNMPNLLTFNSSGLVMNSSGADADYSFKKIGGAEAFGYNAGTDNFMHYSPLGIGIVPTSGVLFHVYDATGPVIGRLECDNAASGVLQFQLYNDLDKEMSMGKLGSTYAVSDFGAGTGALLNRDGNLNIINDGNDSIAFYLDSSDSQSLIAKKRMCLSPLGNLWIDGEFTADKIKGVLASNGLTNDNDTIIQGGTFNQNTTWLGSNKVLSFGTSGDKLNTFKTYSLACDFFTPVDVFDNFTVTGTTELQDRVDAQDGIDNTTGTLALIGNVSVSGTIAGNAGTLTINSNTVNNGTLDQQGAMSNSMGDVGVNDNLVATGQVRQGDTWHAVGGFQDSSVTIAITKEVWAQVTNATGNLFVSLEADGITMSGDTLIIANAGDYYGSVSITYQANAGNAYRMRIYDVTAGAQSGFKTGSTGDGGGDDVEMHIPLYLEAEIGNRYVLQVTNVTDNDDLTAIFSSFWVNYLHD